jgi:hypothetical protein
MWASLDLIGKRAGYAVHEFLSPSCSYRLYDVDWCTQRNREIGPRLNSGEFDLVILAQASKRIDALHADIPAEPYLQLFGELKANGINVAVVKDNPRRPPELESCLLLNRRDPSSCTVPFQPQMDRATQAAIDLDLPIISLDSAYCPNNRCDAVRGGMFLWRDNSHIWPFYHLTAAPLIWSQLMEQELIHPQR